MFGMEQDHRVADIVYDSKNRVLVCGSCRNPIGYITKTYCTFCTKTLYPLGKEDREKLMK